MKKYAVILIFLIAVFAFAGCATKETQQQQQKGELTLEMPRGVLVVNDVLDTGTIGYTAKNGEGEAVSAVFTVELNGKALSGEDGKYLLSESGDLIIRAEAAGEKSEISTKVFELAGVCVLDANTLEGGEGYVIKEDAFGTYAEVTNQQIAVPADLYSAANHHNAEILLYAEGNAYFANGEKISSSWTKEKLEDIVTCFGNPDSEKTLNLSFTMEEGAKVYVRCVYFCDECEIGDIEVRDYAEMRVGETFRIQPAYALMSNGVKLYAEVEAVFNGVAVEGNVITFESAGELVITYTVERTYLQKTIVKTCIVRVTE